MARVGPGLAFSLPCDLGFAVGLVTHQLPRIGDLVWLAEPMFDEEPDLAVAAGISRWRWPILLSVGGMVRRKIVHPLGILDVPPALRPLPRMRSGTPQLGWREVRIVQDGPSQPLGPTNESSLPIYQVVNDTRLKKMLVSGWAPEQEW